MFKYAALRLLKLKPGLPPGLTRRWLTTTSSSSCGRKTTVMSFGEGTHGSIMGLGSDASSPLLFQAFRPIHPASPPATPTPLLSLPTAMSGLGAVIMNPSSAATLFLQGWGHALVLTKHGKLFGWGYYADGRLGKIGKALESSPLYSVTGKFLPYEEITSSMLEAAEKLVLEGIDKEKNMPIIWELEELQDIEVVDVSCGLDHSLVLCRMSDLLIHW